MSMPLDLQSELFSATGGAAAEGVSNQLGRPRVDRFSLLVREAVQNSWDARSSPDGGVRFQIDGYELSADTRHAIAAQVFANALPSMAVRTRLLANAAFPVLAVSDFGTRGLSGPTRGDVVPQPGESTNFVDFMRYIGRPPNRAYGGGTYGFGKAAYFLASSLKTICVHTRFRVGTGMESRFMAAALGPQFESDGPTGRRFTGRHWWGRLAEDEVVDPVIGERADQLAALFGGTDRPPDASGTTVFVLAPDFQGVEATVVLTGMGRALMDYFWPKLVDGPEQTPTMSFDVRWQGAELPLPQLHSEPELALLAQAFASAAAKQALGGAKLEAISSLRPKKLLGHIALVRQPAATGKALATAEPEEVDSNPRARELRRPLHHIALMRAPNFVVKYVEGPAVPYDLAEYAGVFRVDAEADAAFAGAEPPTHDDWVPDLLVDPAEKTYVRVAQRRLKEIVEAFAAPPPIEPTAAGTHSVAGFSRLLGGLIPSLSPEASGPTRPSSFAGGGGGGGGQSAGGRGPGAPQVAFMGEPTVELVDGAPAMVARFQVSGKAVEPVQITAIPKVVVADGFETDPPAGSLQPQVLRWLQPDGRTAASGTASCSIPSDGSAWTVVVSIPPDAMISVTLKAQAKAGG